MKDLALTVQEKANVKVFFKRRNMSLLKLMSLPKLISLEHKRRKKKWCIHDLLDVINNRTKIQHPWKNHKKFKTSCMTLLWPWTTNKVTESGKAQWVALSCRVLHWLHLWYLRKSKCKRFWQAKTLHWQKTCYLPWIHTRVKHIVNCLFNVCSNHTMFTEDKNPKHSFCSLYFWHTCDLKSKSRSSNQKW